MARACESLFDLVTKNFSMGVDGTYSLLREIIIATSGLKRVNLRPPNIFNDRYGHVKAVLTTYVIGQHRQFGSSAYYEQSESGIFGIAGAESEQGAISFCVYFINSLRESGNKCHDMSSILVSGVISFASTGIDVID